MSDLIQMVAHAAEQGSIRQLDYQFARFIWQHSQCDKLAVLAAAASSEVGRGHICLPLRDRHGQRTDLAAVFGLYGERALSVNAELLNFDWDRTLMDSPLVGSEAGAVPLMFDGDRLYLHRYWDYEVRLAQQLNTLAQPVPLEGAQRSELRQLLDHLFARNYSYLFNALQHAHAQGQSTAVGRQQLVCDLLDVVAIEALDWPRIDAVVNQAKHVKDLTPLDQLVPLSACINWQKVAAAVALTRRFAVISGGPGTGKTTTVTKLLAALIEQSQQQMGKMPTIKLVAPTGKAAARLTESIGKAVDQLPVSPELKQAIPTESGTIHRLLGAVPNSVEFRHNRSNPLHLDILVIDEASMVDLPMMERVVSALPPKARLILLGDKDQLASVEAGAVLGDICSFLSVGYSQAQSRAIADLTGFDTLSRGHDRRAGVADSLCMLQKSYRFDARSGIGQLAKAINSGQARHLDQVLEQGFSDIEHFALTSDHYNQLLQTMVTEYGHYLKRINQWQVVPETNKVETAEQKALAALRLFGQCRLLCAIREGDFGVTGLNSRTERVLARRNLIKRSDELWYHGRPVMVTRNDHSLGLYNGDIGLCMREGEKGVGDAEEEAKLKVYFELPDGSIKAVLPSRVPEHETAYAMTVHKSQGSEFDFTLMMLPPDFSPILTRELIYTGVTRAKKKLALYADLNLMKRGIKVKTQRASGLMERLE